ncbi:MBL fold metallo-hydrolase [Poseidonocella sp. HB161398]|uniref:MBL fold metallo-hydrolase n=1 Tax=Poseidonocella sp. HB161398 TaxID=2320855 RepID=UPI0011094586|nr:MBL fold metallo-hydrolase [Poseidonocella sp. HB161398]
MTTRRNLLALSGAAFAAGLGTYASAQSPATPPAGATITQIRNATLRVSYGGVRFLVDPMLSSRQSWPGFAGTVNSEERNPLVHLPLPMADILDVDAVIVTHLHEDHWDETARETLPKSLPVFTQNDADAEVIRSQGFADVRVLSATTEFGGVRLIKTGGRHGSDAAYQAIGDILGQVCGVVLAHPEEKTVYLAGDTIWNDDVARVLAVHRPEVAILNAGYAMIEGLDSGIIMGTADVRAVHQASPDTLLIASHMEAVNHCVLTRAELRSFAQEQGFADMLRTPGDGEIVLI